ncbi:MAG TPA: hypothetical protein VI749_00020 [Candidatus Omnitrophota bacterium]|nr:hypothetical protein [Candidatus Omnitrophota bacterium]
MIQIASWLTFDFHEFSKETSNSTTAVLLVGLRASREMLLIRRLLAKTGEEKIIFINIITNKYKKYLKGYIILLTNLLIYKNTNI